MKQDETARVLVTAPVKVIEAIDRIVKNSPVRTSRSAIALMAIEAGIEDVEKKLKGKKGSTDGHRKVV